MTVGEYIILCIKQGKREKETVIDNQNTDRRLL